MPLAVPARVRAYPSARRGSRLPARPLDAGDGDRRRGLPPGMASRREESVDGWPMANVRDRRTRGHARAGIRPLGDVTGEG
jgi:hypothetical protein